MANQKVLDINSLYKAIKQDELYSVQDLMELSKLSRTSIMNYITDGRIPVTTYNMRQYVYGENFRRYLRGCREYV